MRSATLFVIGIILVGLVLFYVQPPSPFATVPAPPGQYPITGPRWTWPMTERVAYYRPGAAMGSDAVTFAGGDDAKGHCATSPTCAE